MVEGLVVVVEVLLSEPSTQVVELVVEDDTFSYVATELPLVSLVILNKLLPSSLIKVVVLSLLALINLCEKLMGAADMLVCRVAELMFPVAFDMLISIFACVLVVAALPFATVVVMVVDEGGCLVVVNVVEAVTNAVVLSRETNSTFFSSEWLVVSFVTVRLA